MMNIDNSKSYATRENLEKALAKVHLNECKPVVVRNSEGRWTAIFGVSFLQGDMCRASHHGFLTIG